MRVIALPMDNRPPNYRFLNEIAEIHGINLILPPVDMLGRYMEAGDSDLLLAWLLEQSGDVFLISTEMLCYGGLIASRESWTDYHHAEKRLDSILELKDRNPESEIYLTWIVRRASISVYSAGSRELWERMNDYLKLRNSDPDSANLMERSFPDKFIDNYFDLRRRNHKINTKCLESVKAGISDLVVFAQEDTFEGGPQEEELRLLETAAEQFGIREKVYIHNGADEVLQELLVRTFNRKAINVVYDAPVTRNKIMDFEDREFGENVDSHLRLAGFTEDANSETALLIAGSSVPAALNELHRLTEEKKDVYLLDVFRANGSNPELMKNCLDSHPEKIRGYSAWNPASNSLGTILAEAADSKQRDELKLFRFYLNRLIDDHLYQGVFREKLEKVVLSNKGDIYRVSQTGRFLEDFLSNTFGREAQNLLNRYSGTRRSFNGKSYELYDLSLAEFSLPWDRTFECDLCCDFSIKEI